jgi:hypothetical protein
MTKGALGLLFYGIYGLIAAAVAGAFAPEIFAATGYTGHVIFGVMMAGAMFAGNKLEPKAFAALGNDSPGYGARFGVRIAIYMGIPALAVVLLHLIAPSLILLPSGALSVFRAVFMPVAAGAILNFFPARG